VVYTADSIRKFDSKSNRTADSIRTQKNGKPDQMRFTIIEVELIGKSQWCCSTKWDHPLHVLTNNWTRTKQSLSEHTTAPINHNRHGGGQKFFSPTSQLHFQNNGATNTYADPVSNSMPLKLRDGRKGKKIGKGQRRMFIKTNDGPHRGI